MGYFVSTLDKLSIIKKGPVDAEGDGEGGVEDVINPLGSNDSSVP